MRVASAGRRRRPHRFEKGFVRAEIIGLDDLVEIGSIAGAPAKGKEYVMQDGDMAEFRLT